MHYPRRVAPPTRTKLLAPGTVLAGRYEVEALLGLGGMGSVYRGRHLTLDRPVAIKLIGREGHGHDEQVHRFEREAKLLARLSHPGIVAVHDFGTGDDGQRFLVLELVEGRDLASALKRSRLAWQEVAQLGHEVADALAYAHREGVLHRDLKPANIMRVHSGKGGRGGSGTSDTGRGSVERNRYKVIDFGLARLNDVAEHVPGGFETGSRYVLGTPGYIAPEYLFRGDVGPEGDIFALGVVLFDALCGEHPFKDARGGPDPEEAARIHTLASTAPERLRRVIELMLALDPEARPTDPAQTFRQLLHEGGARDEASPLSAGGQVVSLPPDTPTKKARRGPASSQERSSRTTVEVPGGMVELLVGGGQLSQVRVMPFVIDKHLVTQRDYLAFVEATGAAAPSTWSGHKPRRDELAMPVTGVSFEDATAFALWHGRRLPTAAEWDLAARGEQGFTYPWGNTWLTGLSHPTHAQAFEQRRPGPIGVFSPQGDSPFGVSDLLQLWEWVVAPFQARGHMVRGGPWRDRHLPAQLTNQSWEDEAVHDVGFRLAG
jgi:serine/threonine protein kinase